MMHHFQHQSFYNQLWLFQPETSTEQGKNITMVLTVLFNLKENHFYYDSMGQ